MQIHTNYKFRKWHPVFPQSHFCALFEVQNTFSFYIRLFLILLRHKLINQQSSQPFTNQENNRRCWQAAMPELTDSCCSAAMFHSFIFQWPIHEAFNRCLLLDHHLGFYPPHPLCFPYLQENYCHIREQSPEALHCSLLLRAPLGTLGSRFMKLSDGVNGLSIPPPFTPRGGFSFLMG